MTIALSEIVMMVEKETVAAKQTELLKKHSSPALKAIIGYAMDPGVKWLLPPGTPPYKPVENGSDVEGQLYHETKKLIHFVNSPDGRKLKPLKREQLFLQLLESIDPADAKLMIRVKDKGLKGIQIAAVKAAWPGLTKGW